MYELFKKYVPVIKSTSGKTNFPHWYTREIMQLIKEKRKAWNSYRRTKSQYYLDRMKQLRRELKRKMSIEYSNFIKNAECSIKHDPKKFWRFVNGKKRSTYIPG